MPTRRPVSAALLLAITWGCQGRGTPSEAELRSEIVSAAEVVAQLDTARSFEYRFSSVDPDSVLLALWEAELPLSRAWYPLDDRCFNPLGPRLTVELHELDLRILDHDFLKGTGRLACATRLRQYTFPD